MARSPLALALAVVLALCSASAAKPRNVANCDEFSRVVTYAHSLEQNPLAKDNLQMRMWLTEWIVNSPSIAVVPYNELDSLDAVNDTYSQQLRMQAMYSQAAFQLEHPNVKDAAAIRAAGLAGTLRAYRSIQRFDPSAKYPLLDDLASLERKGKLQKYLEHRNKCFDD